MRAADPRPTLPAGYSTAPDFVRTSGHKPLVTVAIPAFNRPALLREALASVAAQKDFTAFEVVVCDDGGLPETREVVEACTVPELRFYVNRSRLGAVQNWNRCIALAVAPWVTLLHEDDLLYPWCLAHLAERLHPGLAAVSVRCVQGATPPALAEPTSARPSRRYAPLWFLKSSMTPFPGVVFGREIALKIGGFDARDGGIADYAFWYALAGQGNIETLREPAAFYRVADGQWTEAAWPGMLRCGHLLRQRIAREQLATQPRIGRWLARFYTARMAKAYARRFSARPAVLIRAERLGRIPFGWIPSGWVWVFLQWLAHRR